MQSKKAACISARGGSTLWVKQCSLACDAGGLPHLYSAIVTARPARPCKSSRQCPTMLPALEAGRGSIVVSETYVQVRSYSQHNRFGMQYANNMRNWLSISVHCEHHMTWMCEVVQRSTLRLECCKIALREP